MKKEKNTPAYWLPNIFHWVDVNFTTHNGMSFSTAQFKLDHGIEYAHFERPKSVVVDYNLCGYCLN